MELVEELEAKLPVATKKRFASLKALLVTAEKAAKLKSPHSSKELADAKAHVNKQLGASTCFSLSKSDAEELAPYSTAHNLDGKGRWYQCKLMRAAGRAYSLLG